jgi:hypothetical protein
MMRYPPNWPKDLPKPPPISKQYFEDEKWMSEHSRELQEKYPDQWVAVVKGEVVAAGKNLAEVERLAEERTGEKEFPVRLVEATRKFYSR